jgi:rhodanese-related sulfurtransferase
VAHGPDRKPDGAHPRRHAGASVRVSGHWSLAASDGTVVKANGGTWTNITPDTLASMLDHKSFTLLNVKTPYIGEIAGTDLYIPYDQVAARATELPTDKAAKVVVYCRSGHESAIAAQALIDLGYTNLDNLDGGMTAWTDSGRSLVQQPRS